MSDVGNPMECPKCKIWWASHIEICPDCYIPLKEIKPIIVDINGSPEERKEKLSKLGWL